MISITQPILREECGDDDVNENEDDEKHKCDEKNNKEDNKDIGKSSRFSYLRMIIRIRVIIYMMIMNEIWWWWSWFTMMIINDIIGDVISN